MKVVSTAKNHTQEPFVDNVPHLSDAVDALMAHRRANLPQKHGAPSPTFDLMETPNEALVKDQAPAASIAIVPPTVPFTVQIRQPNTQEDNIAALLAVALEDDTVLVPEAARRRRLMSGADTSSSKFEETFEQAARCVANGLDLLQPDVLTHDASVLGRTRAMLKELAAEFPDLPEEMYRLIMLAAHFAEGRVPERPMLVDATVLIWMIEGERHLRVHRGFLYIYNEDGCFVMYSGIPPEIVLTRVQRFMRILEGILRRLRPSVRRQGASVAAAIVADMQSFQTVQDFLDACREAASRRVRLQENGRLEDTEMEADAEPAQQDDHCWTDDMASRVFKVFCALQNELMQTRMISLLVEWCETPEMRKPAVCYTDLCLAYDIPDAPTPVLAVKKSSHNDCYVLVPHPLLDPVVKDNMVRLEKFYSQTFWANHSVFLCCQAALAIAKRGLNVDRCFIGQSPGGVGQSLYSQHLAEMYKHNHCFFDPNVWHQEEELRKQVETFAKCFILTGQEAPESSKRLHMDLYKKTMSGDGVTGRKPYGYTTRMFHMVGWKRLEVNRFMTFMGVTLGNFNSILRRALVWKPRARFVHPKFLAHYTDHERDGIFPADPSLSKFLSSQPASCAGLRIQYAFESSYSKEDCYQLIEDYVSGGDNYMTEDCMREACNIPIRQRLKEQNEGLGALVDGDAGSQKDRDEESHAWDSLKNFVINKLLDTMHETLTLHSFQQMTLKAGDSPNLPKDKLWALMEEKDITVKALVNHKTDKKKSVPFLPKLSFKCGLREVCPKNTANTRVIFEESWDMDRLIAYAYGFPHRRANAQTLIAYYEQAAKKAVPEAQKGRPTTEQAERRTQFQKSAEKIKAHERIIEQMQSSASTLQASPAKKKRRLDGKQSQPKNDFNPDPAGVQGICCRQVHYRYSDKPSFSLPARRYAQGVATQNCSRRLQHHVVGSHTVDLDIRNCCLCLAKQLVDKLQPSPAMPSELSQLLNELAGDRQAVIDRLGLTPEHGKDVINIVLNGGSVPEALKERKDMMQLQRLSIYLRWMACNLLYSDYMNLKEYPKRQFPTATIFNIMWSALEDHILSVWSEHLIQKLPNISHLSLHFDGLRISQDSFSDVDTVIADSHQVIKEATGFDVTIVPKTTRSLMELIEDVVARTASVPSVPEVCLRNGNCGPCAMWHCIQPARSSIEAALKNEAHPANASAAELGYRSYRQKLMGLELACCVGLPPADSLKPFLLHAEGAGRPHCVGVRFSSDGSSVSVLDGNMLRQLSTSSFRHAYEKAIDKGTVVSYWQRAAHDEVGQVGHLLDVCAGSGDSGTSSSDGEQQGPKRVALCISMRRWAWC